MNKETIRPIAICLFSNKGQILVKENFDSHKQDSFCRPIGGGIEFGEPSKDAMVREIREELGAEIENLRFIGVLEILFVLEGQKGHQIVFVYDAEFVDRSLYQQGSLQGYEHSNDTHFTVRWRSIEQIEQSQVRLVPEGLIDLLQGQTI